MAWIEPEDIRAVINSLRGEHGTEFDRGLSQLSIMLYRPSAVDGHARAMSHDKVLACARLLVALSKSPEFNVGVIALAAGVLPVSLTHQLPDAINELRAKINRLETAR